MGTFYSAWVTNTDALHLAQYYNVRERKILWINGNNHSQFEIVHPGQIESHIDCRTISQRTPTLHAEALLVMHLLREEKTLGIMDL